MISLSKQQSFTVTRFPIYQSAKNCGTSDKEGPVSQNQEYTILAMKVAFVVPPISGHLNPMTTLARELQSRDHDVAYRDKARYFQKEIAEINGLSKAANLLEQAFGFGNHRQPLLVQH
jgi:hypothetical protein